MATTLQTKLQIMSWDEKPYHEFDDGRKFTRAGVDLTGTGDGVESGRFDSVMYYRADGSASYVTQMLVTGTLDGRSGDIVLHGDGTFDGTTARGTFVVVEGTAELAGISGRGESVSTHGDYPYMPFTLTYELA